VGAEKGTNPIIVLPTMSLATRLTRWSGVYLANYFMKRGNIPVVLNGVWARKWPLKFALQNTNPNHMVCYFGHGYEDSLVGSEFGARLGRRLVSTNSARPVDAQIMEYLQGAVLVTMACLALEELGADLVKHGLGAFLGSSRPMLISRADLNSDGLDDFVDCFTSPSIALAEGATVSEAVEAFKAKSLAYAGLCNDRSKCPVDYKEAMEQNAKFYGFAGDGSLKVSLRVGSVRRDREEQAAPAGAPQEAAAPPAAPQWARA